MVDLLLAHGAVSDSRLFLQLGDGFRERARERGLRQYEKQAEGYYEEALQCDASSIAAHLRLANVQAHAHAVSPASQPIAAAAQTLRNAWSLEHKAKPQLAHPHDVESYVENKLSLALAGVAPADAEEAPAVMTLEDLSVSLTEAGATERALTLWRKQGVVVFPALLKVSDTRHERLVRSCCTARSVAELLRLLHRCCIAWSRGPVAQLLHSLVARKLLHHLLAATELLHLHQ